MGIQERKAREKEKMRKHILDTALGLFKDGGFEAISIRNIASIIEYSPATIYLYFKDKEEIISHLHLKFADELLLKLKEFGFIKDYFSRLKNLSISWVDFAMQNPEKYGMAFAPRTKFADDKVFQYVNDLVLHCINSQQLQRMPSGDATVMIISFLHGMSIFVNQGKFEYKSKPELKESVDEKINRFLNNMGGSSRF